MLYDIPSELGAPGLLFVPWEDALKVAKCNLGKVNLELMLPVVLPSLHMTCGGTPLEVTGAKYVQPCFLAIVAISAFVSESLRIH